MPVLLPPDLPARQVLRAEGVGLIEAEELRAGCPLHIGLVNLMPDKLATEVQFARLLGAAPQAVQLHLFWPIGHTERRTPGEHLHRFYAGLEAVRSTALDGLIITGAPVESLPFEQVRYWRQLAGLYDMARAGQWPTLNICWAALAALWHYRGIDKQPLQTKAFGVFDQTVLAQDAPLMQGVPASFPVPVSRHATARRAALVAGGLRLLAASSESGVSVAVDAEARASLVFDHLEYDAGTLLGEYKRDRVAGLPTALPTGRALGDTRRAPWRPTAHLVVRNWLAEVAAAARARQPDGLVHRLPGSRDDATEHARLVVLARPARGLLAAVAGAAAATAVPLRALGERRADGEAAIDVTLGADVPGAAIDRLSQALLRLGGVRRVVPRPACNVAAALPARDHAA